MFKTTTNKTFTQQRALLKPIKHTALYEEDEDEDNDDQDSFLDDNSSNYSNGAAVTSDMRTETMLLAQFLATTGPEEQNKPDEKKISQQLNRASRLLNRLRKRPTMAVLRSEQTEETTAVKQTHIPLPVYEPAHNKISSQHHDVDSKNNKGDEDNTNARKLSSSSSSVPVTKSNKQQLSSSVLRDSGIYSETNSEKGSCLSSGSGNYKSVPPIPPFASMLCDIQFPNPPHQHKSESDIQFNQPRRLAPLPSSIAAILSASSPTSGVSGSTNTNDHSSRIRSVPEAALKRRSVRLRHVQVQTSAELTPSNKLFSQERDEITGEDKKACPHCRQVITKDIRNRRTSSPPALATGRALLPAKDSEDSKVLLAMIIKLKSQLEEEKRCRIKLEKAINRQHQTKSHERKEQLAREKDRWADHCLWLNDRLAFLPE